MNNRTVIEKISPLWPGVGISGSLLVVLLATETALGRWDEILVGGEFDAFANVSIGVLRDVRIAFVHCLLIGYLPAAFLHVLRRSRQTVFALPSVELQPRRMRGAGCIIKAQPGWTGDLRILRFGVVFCGALPGASRTVGSAHSLSGVLC